MISLFNTFISGLLLLFALRRAFTKDSPVNYWSGFAAGAAVYLVLFNAEVAGFHTFDSVRYAEYYRYVEHIGGLTNIYIFSFLLTSYIFERIFPALDGLRNIIAQKPRDGLIVHILFLCGCTALFLVVYGALFFSSLGYVGGAETRYQNTGFSVFLKFLILYGLFIVGYSIDLNKRKVSILLGLTILVMGFLTADKDLILFSVICFMYIFSTGSVRISPGKLIFLGITLVGFLVFVPIFSVYRAGIPLDQSISIGLSKLSLTNMDPNGPYSSILNFLATNRSGSGYLSSLEVLVPRVLLPYERGLDPAEEYARENMVNWSPGMGLGFSPIAEGYSNFGAIGVFLQGSLLSIAFLFSWLAVRFIFKKAGLLTTYSRYFMIVSFYVMIISFRTSLVGTVKFVLLQILGTTILIFIVAGIARMRLRR